jgi:hypothetical protein
MHFIVRSADASPGHIVEAALDRFMVIDSAVTTEVSSIATDGILQVFPNPSADHVNISWDLGFAPSALTYLSISDVSGREIRKIVVAAQAGTIQAGEELAQGIYFVRLVNADGVSSSPVQIIRTK